MNPIFIQEEPSLNSNVKGVIQSDRISIILALFIGNQVEGALISPSIIEYISLFKAFNRMNANWIETYIEHLGFCWHY